jgi:hypothetical protein
MHGKMYAEVSGQGPIAGTCPSFAGTGGALPTARPEPHLVTILHGLNFSTRSTRSTRNFIN